LNLALQRVDELKDESVGERQNLASKSVEPDLDAR
jgi:hypothetical protein